MIERSDDYPEEEAPSEDGAGDSDTTSIPASIIGDQTVQPGDVIRLKVIAVDENNGSIEVAYAHSDKSEPEMGGTKKMMEAFEG